MPRFTPQWLIAPAAVAVVAAVWLIRPEPSAVGRDAAAHTDLELEAVSHELQARQDAVFARIAYKDQLIDKLIAGRATLPEVAGEFLYLNQDTRFTPFTCGFSGTAVSDFRSNAC